MTIRNAEGLLSCGLDTLLIWAALPKPSSFGFKLNEALTSLFFAPIALRNARHGRLKDHWCHDMKSKRPVDIQYVLPLWTVSLCLLPKFPKHRQSYSARALRDFASRPSLRPLLEMQFLEPAFSLPDGKARTGPMAAECLSLRPQVWSFSPNPSFFKWKF